MSRPAACLATSPSCWRARRKRVRPRCRRFWPRTRRELSADLALVCDTGMWDRTTPAITTMLRGLVLEEVTIRAADRDLHSGLYGGAAVNPIHVLSKIVADLHDAQGRVTLPNFYDGVEDLPEDIARQWRALDFDEHAFLSEVGLSMPARRKGPQRSRADLGRARPPT